MMGREHRYNVSVTWTGNSGRGSSGYRNYERSYNIAAPGKEEIAGSADPLFRGNPVCWNPEELLVASISACHKLWYLHLCSEAGIAVQAYVDQAEGIMEGAADGSGRFSLITLRPHASIPSELDRVRALMLHEQAHAKCLIANSVNFPILLHPTVEIVAS